MLTVFLILLIGGCQKNQNSDYGFFAWMDAYIAAEVDTENILAITLFFDKEPFEESDIVSISFLDIDKEIVINSFKVDNLGDLNRDYSTYGITLNYSAEEMGVFETSGVKVMLHTDGIIEYPIGKWIFDIGESSEEVVNAWESPAASSNSENFSYSYTVKDSDTLITKVYYGNDRYINNDKGSINSGMIDLSADFSSPIVYIRSKIEVLVDNEYQINYGKGCYCGAMDFTEDEIEISKKQNSIQ